MKRKSTRFFSLYFLLFLWANLFAQSNDHLSLIISGCLKNNTEILIGINEINISQAVYKQILGEMDIVQGTDITYDHDTTPLSADDPAYATSGYQGSFSDNLGVELWASKPFLSGLTINPSVFFDYVESSNIKVNDALDSIPADSTAGAYLTLQMDLLKSFRDTPALLNREAYYHLILQQQAIQEEIIADAILQSFILYWEYAASIMNLKSQQDIIESLLQIRDTVEKQINVGKYSNLDLSLIDAEIAESRSLIISAEQTLLEKRTDLYLHTGISMEEIESWGDFVLEMPIQDLKDSKALEKKLYISTGMNHRPELKAAREYLNYLETLSKRTAVQSRPNLDLEFYFGYKGTNYGDGWGPAISSIGSNIRGLDAGGSISFSLDIPNRTLKGEEEERQLYIENQNLSLRKAEKRISSSIDLAFRNYSASIQILENAGYALNLYKDILDSKTKRVNAGLSPVSEILDAKEDYLEAEQYYYEDLIQSLTTLLNLRYETGTLVNFIAGQENFSWSALLTPPLQSPSGE